MISVVMAVYNGQTTLPLTLEAFAFLEVPSEAAELIVVDNASSDATPDLVRAFEGPLAVTLLYEPEPGRSRALNRGVRAASGDLVVFTDDDVLPDADWLLAYSDAKQAFPDVDIFAGQIRHYWQKQPPKWLERLAAEGMSYGGTPVGRTSGPVEAREVKGANLAVRARLLSRMRLREDVGYGANGDMVAGDETAFVRAAIADGFAARFVAEARLRHIVRRHEVALWPVLRRYFRIGRGMAAVDPASFPRYAPRMFGCPRYLLREISENIANAFIRFISFDLYRCNRTLIDVAIKCGQAYEWRRNE